MKRPSRPSSSGVGAPLGAKLASRGVLPTSTQRPRGRPRRSSRSPASGHTTSTQSMRFTTWRSTKSAARGFRTSRLAKDSGSNASRLRSESGYGSARSAITGNACAVAERERERCERQIAHQQPIGAEARDLLAQRERPDGVQEEGNAERPAAARAGARSRSPSDRAPGARGRRDCGTAGGPRGPPRPAPPPPSRPARPRDSRRRTASGLARFSRCWRRRV